METKNIAEGCRECGDERTVPCDAPVWPEDAGSPRADVGRIPCPACSRKGRNDSDEADEL